MKHEFHAQYPFALQDSVTQAFTIEWLVEKSGQLPHRWQELASIQDSMQRIDLLSQAILTAYKEQARMGTRREAGGYRFWAEKRAKDFLAERLDMMKQVQTILALPDLSAFPPGSWGVQLTFTLRKPYISKDDTELYIIDNPVKKEWVFKVPYVAPSQWKGALRAAMVRELADDLRTGEIGEREFVEKRLRLYRLFGNEKDGTAAYLNRTWALHRVNPKPDDEQGIKQWEEEFRRTLREVEGDFERTLKERRYRVGDVEGFQGRLYFYPTYFSHLGLEIINPHDRRTGAGKQPIYFECVPTGTQGAFTLLCVSLDGASEKEVLADLEVVAHGLWTMLTRYGFGAKTSSGYGVAKVQQDKISIEPQEYREAFFNAWLNTKAGGDANGR